MKMLPLGSVFFLLLTAASASPCSFEQLVTSTGEIEFDAWVRVRGEAMLYPDQQSMRKNANFPNCISSHFGESSSENIKKYDRKRVHVVGELYNYNNLSDDDAPLMKRKLLQGFTIPNQCLGENVLLLKSMKIMR